MNVLITGGAGFIGSHLAEHFQGRANIRVLDDLSTGRFENLTGFDVEFIQGSILDLGAVRRVMQGIDYVFHLAALASVPESVRNPKACAEVNVTGLLNVLETASENHVRKLFFSSSAAVYGDNPVVPKREEMRPEPCSPYAMTKLDGEFYCQLFAEEGRLPTVALRFFNVFGPRQRPDGPYAAAVPIFFRQALSGQPITIYGDGGQTRDFIYVKDIAAAIEFLTTAPEAGGVFNAGYGDQITILELARKIIALTKSSSPIRFEPLRPGDVRHSHASIERLRAAGFRPGGTVGEGLQRMLLCLTQDVIVK